VLEQTGAPRHERRAATATPASALGRAGRGRVAPVEGGLRAIHQQVLRSFAATGLPPAAADLAATAARYATAAEAVLAILHTEDFLQLAADGQIRAAYPFSATPTPHLVDLAGRPRVYAMCAIDALGIAAMTHTPVTITSTDPYTGGPVTVTVSPDGETASWQPPAAVVFAGRHTSADCCAAPAGSTAIPGAAEVSCGYVNFFTSSASAVAWADAQPEVAGEVLGQAAALRLGTAIFGPLLAGRY
jgi:hypothetical protein